MERLSNIEIDGHTGLIDDDSGQKKRQRPQTCQTRTFKLPQH